MNIEQSITEINDQALWRYKNGNRSASGICSSLEEAKNKLKFYHLSSLTSSYDKPCAVVRNGLIVFHNRAWKISFGHSMKQPLSKFSAFSSDFEVMEF